MTSPSPHFDDFAPELVGPVDGYASEMVGPGRWFAAITKANHLVGVVWTDDVQGLGVLGLVQSDRTLVAAMQADFRARFSQGQPAAAVFDGLLNQYPEAHVFSGDLSDIVRSL